jgi:TetR/AcrR family transcriptional regulator
MQLKARTLAAEENIAPADAGSRGLAEAQGKTTRQLLLDVATQQFADYGYDGARVDKIVAACGVSKNLLYHYFDSKEALFVAVMEQAYSQMRLRQSEWSFADLEPSEAIERLVVYTFDHFWEQPNIINLLNTENLHKARHITQSKGIFQLYNPLRQTILEILKRGQSAGIFRDDVDVVDLYITISGLSYFYFSNRYTLSYIFQQDLSAEDRVAQRRRHCVDVVLGYLRRQDR